MSGEGHYLGNDHTLQVMQSEYIYPELSDRDSPIVWADNGKPVLLAKAQARKAEILASHYPAHVSDEVDAEVRRRFPIALSRESIGRS